MASKSGAARIAFCALIGLALAGCAGGVERANETEAQVNPLVSDHPQCSPALIQELPQACRTATFALDNGVYEKAWAAPLASTSELPRVDRHQLYSVALVTSGDQSSGKVVLRSSSQVGDQFTFALGTPSAPFRIRNLTTGAEVAPTCATRGPSTAPCAHLKAYYSVALEPDRDYALELGPLPGAARTINLVVESNSTRHLGTPPICSTAVDFAGLADVCSGAATTTVDAATLSASTRPTLSAGASYGIRLRPIGDGYEGAVDVVAPHTGDYLLALGTPSLGVALSAATPVVPKCLSRLTSAVLEPSIGAESCEGFEIVRRISLVRNVPLRLALGPGAKVRWVRAAVIPQVPDSDGDGLADNLDGCPSDPAKTAPLACGCNVPETPDSDGDGTLDCSDPCVLSPDDDADGDGVCGDRDDCPFFWDPAQDAGPECPTPSNWTYSRYDLGRTAFNPVETTIVAATVSSLHVAWQKPLELTQHSRLAVVNSRVFALRWPDEHFVYDGFGGTALGSTRQFPQKLGRSGVWGSPQAGASGSNFLLLDAAGKLLFSRNCPDEINCSVSVHHDDLFYWENDPYRAESGLAGTLDRYDLASGALLNRMQGTEDASSPEPAFANGRAYTLGIVRIVHDECEGEPGCVIRSEVYNELMAQTLDAQIVYRARLSTSIARFTSPVVVGGRIFSDYGVVEARDEATGAPLWASELAEDSPLQPRELASDGERVYALRAGTASVKVIALRAATGEIAYERSLSLATTRPVTVIAADVLYVGSGPRLFAFNATSGEPLLDLALGADIYQLAVAQGHVYAITAAGLVALAP